MREAQNDHPGPHEVHRVKDAKQIGLVRKELNERIKEADAEHDEEGDVADFVLVLLPVPADLSQLDQGDDGDREQVQAATELVVEVVRA